MKILIIGSKGFIGSHCVTYFSKEHEVWQCDVVVDYITPNYIILDPSNADYSTIFSNRSYDVCINCSGAASVPDSIQHPQRDFELNTHNVFRQLDAIRRFNPKCKYINLSSAAVYGNPDALPVKESQSLQPISPYGIHKKMAETICTEFYEQFGIATCSLRIFSAYGPGLHKQLFWDLHQKYKNDKIISLFGTGKESRDFIYISDLVSAIYIVMLKASFIGEAINIANGKEHTIQEVVHLFYELINPNINYEFKGQQRGGDPINWVADCTTLHKMGYQQKIDIRTGLTYYILWLNKNE